MHDSCMAIKTISLELDAYEKLRAAKRGGESFSSVVRRAVIPGSVRSGLEVLDYFKSEGPFLKEAELDAIEAANAGDMPPANPWEELEQ